MSRNLVASSTGRSAGFRPLRNLVDECRRLPVDGDVVGTIGHQGSNLGKFGARHEQRQAVAERELGGTVRRQARLNHHRLHAASCNLGKRRRKRIGTLAEHDLELEIQGSRRSLDGGEKWIVKRIGCGKAAALNSIRTSRLSCLISGLCELPRGARDWVEDWPLSSGRQVFSPLRFHLGCGTLSYRLSSPDWMQRSMSAAGHSRPGVPSSHFRNAPKTGRKFKPSVFDALCHNRS